MMGSASSRSASSLNNREFLRWFWRQLTSMRTALMLLLLLALAAVPGSLFPQRSVDAQKVANYFLAHPTSAPILDNIGLFAVYSSPWFSAIYLLVMVSLVGCIIPRVGVYARALRARPPKAPKNFSRMSASASFETEESVSAVLAAGRQAIGRARIDLGDGELRAEKGYLREAGNLVFHICLLVVLVGVASGMLWGYRGGAIVTEGSGFSNSLTQYDEFSSGALFDASDLPPFSLALENFTAKFQLKGPQRGAPRLFEATGTYVEQPGAKEKPFSIEVNHPLEIDGTSIFLVGQGYAPVIKVTDADGNVAFSGAVPFLPSDATYTSTGVVKVPDAQPEQLGFQGFFLPTAVSVGDKAPVSAFPAAANPLLGLFAYHGDLGLDEGVPQSVYVLDKDKLTQFQTDDAKALRLSLSPGQTADLPDGSTLEFVRLSQFTKLQFSSTPMIQVPLWGISLGVLGLMMSLAIKPRRTWIRARQEGSRTLVEVAALDRVSRDDLPTELGDLVERLQSALARQKDDA